ncbi:MAG: hypothetical protein ACRELB_03645 [Polyangiaceae bacterium]
MSRPFAIATAGFARPACAFTFAFALAGAAGCGKPSPGGTPPGPEAAGVVVERAPSPASASVAPSASAPLASSSWSGDYKSAVANITVTPDWKKVHWVDTQSTAGVGDGKMTLAVEGATGRVTGSLEGPLGPATLDGALIDGKLTAALVRKDPVDQGFAGTLVGTVTGDKATGTITASPGGGGTARTATFTLARAAAP